MERRMKTINGDLPARLRERNNLVFKFRIKTCKPSHTPTGCFKTLICKSTGTKRPTFFQPPHHSQRGLRGSRAMNAGESDPLFGGFQNGPSPELLLRTGRENHPFRDTEVAFGGAVELLLELLGPSVGR